MLTASSGERGLDLARSRLPDIDLVLTDLTIPGLDGAAVVSVLCQLRPTLPLAVMSGWAEPEVRKGVGDLADAYLRKPLTLAALPDTLAALLTRGTP